MPHLLPPCSRSDGKMAAGRTISAVNKAKCTPLRGIKYIMLDYPRALIYNVRVMRSVKKITLKG